MRRVAATLSLSLALTACDTTTARPPHIRIYSAARQMRVDDEVPFYIERLRGSETTPVCIEARLTGPGEFDQGRGRRFTFVGRNGIWTNPLRATGLGIVRVYVNVDPAHACNDELGGDAGNPANPMPIGDRSAVTPLEIEVVTELTSRPPDDSPIASDATGASDAMDMSVDAPTDTPTAPIDAPADTTSDAGMEDAGTLASDTADEDL